MIFKSNRGRGSPKFQHEDFKEEGDDINWILFFRSMDPLLQYGSIFNPK